MLNSIYHEKTLAKIITAPEKLRTMLERKHEKETVVLVKGVYDLFHTGHYYSFVNAKTCGDILIVAVNSDIAVKKRKGTERPIINQDDRMILIAALSCVDWVTLYDEVSPYNLLKTIQPTIFAASHFDSLQSQEKLELQEFVKFQIIPKIGGNSTTDIIRKIKKEEEVDEKD